MLRDASEEVGADLLGQLLETDPARIALALAQAGQKQRAGRSLRPVDWPDALQAPDPTVRASGLSTLERSQAEVWASDERVKLHP